MTTKEQVIELCELAGLPVTDYGSGPFIDDGVTTQMVERLIKLVRNAALEEAATRIAAIGDGYGVLDVGLSREEYSRMKQTAREHSAAIELLQDKA